MSVRTPACGERDVSYSFFLEGERKRSGRGTGYAVLDIDVFARFLQFFERGDEGVDVGVC